MSEEMKQSEEKVETAVEESPKATEKQVEPVKEKPCCAKGAGHINFWKLATVFLLLAWAVQNWRITQAEEEAKKLMPILSSSINCPTPEDNMEMQDQVMQQVDQLKEYMSMNPRGIAPNLEDFPDNLVYKMFVPGLKNYKVNTSIKDNVLTIDGQVSTDKKAKGQEGVLISESTGKFNSTVKLPCAVKVNKMTIDKSDNVIQIVMPKVTPTPVAPAADKVSCAAGACPSTIKPKTAAAVTKAAPVKK